MSRRPPSPWDGQLARLAARDRPHDADGLTVLADHRGAGVRDRWGAAGDPLDLMQAGVWYEAQCEGELARGRPYAVVADHGSEQGGPAHLLNYRPETRELHRRLGGGARSG